MQICSRILSCHGSNLGGLSWLVISRPVAAVFQLSALSLPVVLLFLHQAAYAQSKVSKIDSLLQTSRSRGQLNGSVLVSERGRIIYSKAFGYADFEKRTPVLVSSAFELASVSKPFTALAIMMLKERGKLSYDDPLTKYFPGLAYDGVTIRHMLTHTGGLPEYEPLFGNQWPTDRVVTNADIVTRLAELKTPALFAPGTRWKYDRTAYLLLARLVEIVSGNSFEEFLKSNVFTPLGMKDSFVFNAQTIDRVPNVARGYCLASMWSDEYVSPRTLPRYTYIIYDGDTAGPRGVYSSAEDLFRWIQALNTGKLVDNATLQEAYTPARLNDGSVPTAGGGAGNDLPSHYGYGWFIQEGPDGKTVRHTGDWPGYITCVIHNLRKDQTIIVLTNASDPAAVSIANSIESILNDHPYSLAKMSVGRLIGTTINARGIEAALSQYRKLKRDQQESYNFSSEDELNGLGYELLRRDRKRDAIGVFSLNVESFPNSWNVYDSLGEAYAVNGDRELAIQSYRRSLALNPDNRNGAEALKKLESK